MHLTDDELLRRYEAWEAVGRNNVKAAALLEINEAQVRRSVRKAVKRGLTDDFLSPALPEGYLLGKVTSLVGEDGTRLEWQHKLPEAEYIQATIDGLIDAMKADITPLPEIISRSALLERDLNTLTLYPVTDVHLGQYSWGKETGENYDLDIAKAQFQRTASRLYAQTPTSETALIVVLGDFFHADNNDATTARHGNHLDVDGRHDKTLFVGAELIIWHVDMALQKHANVVVKIMRGNHDEYASKALTMALWFRYQNNPRVNIERSPKDLWTYEFGVNMLSFTHGDNVKAENMPGAMAAFYPGEWGRTKYRFGFSGHFHKQKKGPLSDEKDGAVWEIIPAFTAKDAWNRNMGHAGHRAMQAITFHVNEGRIGTVYANVT